MGDRGYRMLGRATWKGGRWYLRRRYRAHTPSKRRAGLALVGLAAAGVVVKLVLGRASDAVEGKDR